MSPRGRELQSSFQSSTASRGESQSRNPWRRAAQTLQQGGVRERQRPGMCDGEDGGQAGRKQK